MRACVSAVYLRDKTATKRASYLQGVVVYNTRALMCFRGCTETRLVLQNKRKNCIERVS